LVKIRLILQR